MPGRAASPVAVSRTPRPARSSSLTSRWRSSLRICWLIAEEVRWCRRAAAPTDPLRAMASRLSRAGRRAASIIQVSLRDREEDFTILTGWTAAYSAATEDANAVITARQGLGRSHGPDAALGIDAAPDRAPPDPRGHLAAGVPGAARAPGAGADAGPNLRDPRPHHPHHRPAAAVRRPRGGGEDGPPHAQRPAERGAVLRARQRQAGDRARDRARTGPDPARHDYRVRRQPHLHPRSRS